MTEIHELAAVFMLGVCFAFVIGAAALFLQYLDRAQRLNFILRAEEALRRIKTKGKENEHS